MSVQQRGLGRGLNALLGGVGPKAAATSDDIIMVPLDAIQANPLQPRKSFQEHSLNELASSIQAQGVLQPVLLRRLPDDADSYELIAGERRWRAAKLARLRSIPAIVKEVSEEESLTLAIIENLQREDLNPLEEALGFAHLQQLLKLSHEMLAERVGKSRSTVTNSLRLLQLPETAQKALREGLLTAGHARALLSLANPARIDDLLTIITEQGLSVREAEHYASHCNEHDAFPYQPAASAQSAERSAGPKVAARSEEILSIETELAERLGCQVQLKGTLRKGKLVIPFASSDQLRQLRNLLCNT